MLGATSFQRGPQSFQQGQQGGMGGLGGWIGSAPSGSANMTLGNGHRGGWQTNAAAPGMPSMNDSRVMGPTPQYGTHQAPNALGGTTFTAANTNYTAPSALAQDGRLGAMGRLLGSNSATDRAAGEQQLAPMLSSQYGGYLRGVLGQYGYTPQTPGIGW